MSDILGVFNDEIFETTLWSRGEVLRVKDSSTRPIIIGSADDNFVSLLISRKRFQELIVMLDAAARLGSPMANELYKVIEVSIKDNDKNE